MPVERQVYHGKNGRREYVYERTILKTGVSARVKERLRERARREGKTMAQMVRIFVAKGLASA